jgi:CheY-like chemotaxis protein
MKQHILLIDDDKDELSVFLDALYEVPTEDGFKCTFARSTSQALTMLKFLVPDFIFIEMNLPLANSLDFIYIIRQETRLRQAKIYLYSKGINEKVTNKAMLLGASGCIAKPGNVQNLSYQLRTVLYPSLRPAYVFSGG